MGRVGLTPIPDDANIAEWLYQTLAKHDEICTETLKSLDATVGQQQESEPDIFAYGKLMNYLASKDVTRPELIALCAAALWRLHVHG